MWEWGNCLKYFKRGWNTKEGRANKDFKKGGKLGQGVGALKRGGPGIPLPTMSIIKGKHEGKDEKSVTIKVW